MENSGGRERPNVPAVLPRRPGALSRRLGERPAVWQDGRVLDRLGRAARHPVVAGTLTTTAGLLLRAGLRALAAGRGGQPALLPGPGGGQPDRTVTTAQPTVVFSRTVVVETIKLRYRRG